MQFIDQYIAYFKYLATQHPDLRHDDATRKRVFDVISVEEAVGDLRVAAVEKGFLFRLIIPTYQIGGSAGTEDSMKSPMGGFIISKYYNSNAKGEEKTAALTAAEKVNDEIIERMIHDSKAGHPLFNYSLNSEQQTNSQPRMQPTESYVGWLTTFQYNNWWRNCITASGAPAWLDGGNTPNTL